MADLSSREIDLLLTQLSKILGGSGSAIRSTPSSGTRSSASTRQGASKESKEASKAVELSVRSLKKSTQEFENLAKLYKRVATTTEKTVEDNAKGRTQLKAANRIKDKYDAALEQQSSILNAYSSELNKFTRRDFLEHIVATRKLVDNTTAFTSKLAKAQQNSSLLSASLLNTYNKLELGSVEYEHWLSILTDGAKGMDKAFLKNTKVWDEKTQDLKDSLNPEDFQDLIMKAGQAQSVLTEAFQGLAHLGVKAAADFTPSIMGGLQSGAAGLNGNASSNRDEVSSTILETLKRFHSLNIAIDGLAIDLDKDLDPQLVHFAKDIENTLPILAKFETSLAAGTDKINKTVVASHTEVGAAIIKMKANFGSINDALAFMGKTATFSANLAKAKSGIGQSYKDMTSFNIAQVPATFAQVSLESIKLGMSFEETVKYLQENSRTLAIYGQKEFSTLSGNIGATFKQFGYNAAQSASMIGPAIASAVDSSAVNVSNGDELNKFIKESMDSFQKVSGIVGMTAESYFKLNSELYNSEGINNILLGLDKSQSKLYAANLRSQRDELVVRGVSIEQAQEIIKQQAAMRAEKVGDRVSTAGKMFTQMQALGFDAEESMKAYQTVIAGNAATKEDKDSLAALMPEFAKRKAQYGTQFNESGNVLGQLSNESIMEGTQSSSIDSLTKAFDSVVNADKTGQKVTNAAGVAAAAKGNESLAGFSNVINSVSSLMSNSFVAATTGSILALAGLAGQALLTATSLGAVGGGSILGKAKGLMGKGAVGKGLAIGGKGLAGGLGGLAGYGLSTVGEGQVVAGNTKTGTAMDIGGNMLSMASTGAMIGSFFGHGLGTLIGGGVGALAGGAYGLYSNRDTLFGSPSSATPTPTVTPTPPVDSSASQVASAVTDSSTRINNKADSSTQLSAIAENTAITAKILQLMFNDKGVKRTSGQYDRTIPTFTEAVYNRS